MADNDLEKNIHEGHRNRLIDTVYNVGLSGLSMVQATEFVLFYIFPRGDVNPLAHRLIDKYKKFSNILDATVEDIANVKGMGITSAKKLKLLVEVFNLYTICKGENLKGISTFGDIYNYIEKVLRYKTQEEFYIFGFNAKGEFIGDRCLAKGSGQIVGIDLKAISNFVNSYNAVGVVLAHNHPGGSCHPSEKDLSSHAELVKKFEFSGYALVDNMIVGEDGIYSIKNRCMMRLYSPSDIFAALVANSTPNDNK